MKKAAMWILGVVALVPVGFALAQHDHKGSNPPGATKAAEKAPQLVELAVTDEGFVPNEVHVKAGQPLKLRVTRKTEATCAKDIVIKSLGINKPLNTPVEVELTPAKGKVRYACAMDMIAGVIIAE